MAAQNLESGISQADVARKYDVAESSVSTSVGVIWIPLW